MKKYFVIFVLGSILLTGCGKGKNLVCTSVSDDMTKEEKFTFKDSKIATLESSVIFENEDYAEAVYGLATLDKNANVRKEGTKVTLVISSENIETQYGGMTKDDIKNSLESKGYTCK